MADFLIPARQSSQKGSEPDTFLSLSKTTEPLKAPAPPQALFKGDSPEEALESLKNQPSYDTLLAVLKYLRNESKGKHDFDVRQPGPLSAQIVHILVAEIVPNYWPVLQETADKGGIDLLLACLRSLPGINSALTFMRSLIQVAKPQPKDSSNSHLVFNLVYTLRLLAALLDNDEEVMRIWYGIVATNDPIPVLTLREEFLSLFANEKVVSISAEAEDICRQAGRPIEALWITDNKQYTNWLARAQTQWIKSQPRGEDVKVCAELGARALRLGHAGMFGSRAGDNY